MLTLCIFQKQLWMIKNGEKAKNKEWLVLNIFKVRLDLERKDLKRDSDKSIPNFIRTNLANSIPNPDPKLLGRL